MGRGLRQIQQRLIRVDCIVEVHDARVPLSGRCAKFDSEVIGPKPHLFVLNKADLCDRRYDEEVLSRLHSQGINNVLFTVAKERSCPNTKKLMSIATSLIKKADRYNRASMTEYSLMIIGVPNVGKSSLINRLRNTCLRKASVAPVGAVAGITRSVMNRIKVNESPPVYLHDTPGILTPNVGNVYGALKLAVVGCLQDHLVGPTVLADYLLFWLNRRGRFEYVNYYGLPQPCDDITHVLTFITAKFKLLQSIRQFDRSLAVRPDLDRAAELFLRAFRSGELGVYCLDEDILE